MYVNSKQFYFQIIQSQDTEKHKQDILKIKSRDNSLMKNNVLYKYHCGRNLSVIMFMIKFILDGKVEGKFFLKNFSSLICTNEIDKMTPNCVTYLLYNGKRGKQEGELHHLPKEEKPLQAILIIYRYIINRYINYISIYNYISIIQDLSKRSMKIINIV